MKEGKAEPTGEVYEAELSFLGKIFVVLFFIGALYIQAILLSHLIPELVWEKYDLLNKILVSLVTFAFVLGTSIMITSKFSKDLQK